MPYFIGTSSNFPTASTYSSKNGLEIYWDVKHPQGETVFLNHCQGGAGGFDWYTIGAYHYRSNLMYLDDNKNLSLLNNISCNSLTVSGNVTCATLELTGDFSCDNISSQVMFLCNDISTTGDINISSTTSSTSQTIRLLNLCRRSWNCWNIKCIR